MDSLSVNPSFISLSCKGEGLKGVIYTKAELVPRAAYAHHCGRFHPFGICSVNAFASLILIKPDSSRSIAVDIRCPYLAIGSSVHAST
jgi:hypothetical protein